MLNGFAGQAAFYPLDKQQKLSLLPPKRIAFLDEVVYYIVNNLDKFYLQGVLAMVIVRQILKGKGSQVFSVTPDTAVVDVLKLMAEQDIGAVLVMEGIKVVGIFSERDYARRGILKGRTVDAPVSESMTKVVYYVGPDQTMEECMAQMTDKRIRHLPVVEAGKVIGVISIGDVVKAIITDQKSQITGMENYILGRDYNQ